MQTLFQKDDQNTANSYELIIEFTGGLDRYALFNSSHLAGLYEDTGFLKDSLDLFRDMNIASVTALPWTPRTGLIPDSLWDEAHTSEYVARLFSDTSGQFRVDSVISQNARCVYGFDEKIASSLLSWFPGTTFRCPLVILIDYLIDVKNIQDALYVHLTGHLLTTILIGNGKLIHTSHHNVRNSDEILYYTSYVRNEFNYEDGVLLGGDFTTAMADLMDTYFVTEVLSIPDPIPGIDHLHRFNTCLNPLLHAHN